MTFVLDASVAASWLLPDETAPVGEASYELIARDDALVPTLWWFEVRNMLVVNERRGRLDEATTARILAALGHLPIGVDSGADDGLLMTLARRHGLTIYDAAYLELACRRQLPLATLDRALTVAARNEGVVLIG